MKFAPQRAIAAPVMALSAALLLSACSSTHKQDGGASAAEASGTPAAKTAASAAAAPAVAAIDKPAPKTPTPGEAALADGLKSYQAGQYKQSEAQLKAAIKAGLASTADQVSAHKHLAFIYCTSKRVTLCTAAFKNARAADPAFALSKSEAGHPMWAKAYRNAMAAKL